MNKLIQIKNIKTITKNGKRIVFMSGAFDIMHFGHVQALKKAASLGDVLIVQIDGNRLVRKRKGKTRPFLDEKFRALVISSVTYVDYVFISNTPSEWKSKLNMIRPSIYIRAIQTGETVMQRKSREELLLQKYREMKIHWLKQHPEISTSKILEFGGAIKRSHILAIS